MTNSDKGLPTVAAMCLFKNEAMVMEEYLRHHAAEGITEFVLIDDGSTDNGPSIAKDIANKLNVSVTLPPAVSTPVRYNQRNIMTDALKAVSADWLARIDLDEFLFTESGNIPEFLAHLSENVTKVQIEWQMFSSEGAYYKQPKSLINSYVHTATNGRGKEKKEWGQPFKSIGKTSEIITVGCHDIKTKSGTSLKVKKGEFEKDRPEIRMNHYRSQSREYFFKVQIPRTYQNSLFRRVRPSTKYNIWGFGLLDPPDGGTNSLLRNKRTKNGEWMETRLAEPPLWPKDHSRLTPGLLLENTYSALIDVVRKSLGRMRRRLAH